MNRTATNGSTGLENLLEEVAARLEAGEAIDVAAFASAHPEHAEQLRQVLPTMLVLADLGRPPAPAEVHLPPRGLTPNCPPARWATSASCREVGRGGMGIVYEAEQISLGRRVALKVLPFAATMDPRHLQRFQNEARAAAALEHPHIVPIYGVGCERAVHFYAMKFIDGQSLAELIADQESRHRQGADRGAAGPLPHGRGSTVVAGATTQPAPHGAAYFRRIADWGIQAAEALDHAHQMGIVHRDVKPANLLVDTAGRLWVTDFGLAQVQSDVRVTMTGDLVGTLRYMSPEQALAKRVVVDHRTDVYSLGATLYELLTLEPAFSGTDRQELLRQIAFEEPKPPRRIDKAIPAELETIVLKAMEKNPAERYATAKEVAEDLHRFLNSEPIRARPPTLVQWAGKWARRHRPAVTATAVCLSVMLTALIGSVGWALSERAARRDKVLEALTAAEPGLRHGNPWDPTLTAAAQRAEAQLGRGLLGADLRQRVEQLRKDLGMLAELERIRLEQAGVLDELL